MERVLQVKLDLAEKPWFYRSLEVFPGAMTWLFLLAPILLSLVRPVWVAYFIIAFDLLWLVKSFRLSFFLIRGYSLLHANEKANWSARLSELEDLDGAVAKVRHELTEWLQLHPGADKRGLKLSRKQIIGRRKYLNLAGKLKELAHLAAHQSAILNPKELYNVVLLATYNESLEILEPSVQALAAVDYPLSQLMLVIAYEERGGEQTERNCQHLIKKYGPKFAYAAAIKHPDGLPGEVRAKGANITYAARKMTQELVEKGIDPEHVIVTTLDADHRPSKNYFAYLSYLYATDPNRLHKSYQPIPMFYNNIWDAPAPMRVIATGNSFWLLMESMRPHRLRNFAAHAQGLKTLIDTNYWSVTSIVEDGHQYWRTYFTYNGDHKVVPLYAPIYQDAVLAETYPKTFKVQYRQLRRWAWGVSDFAYVVTSSIRHKSISWPNKGIQIWRLFEGHFSWATAPLTLSFVAWLPLFLNRSFSDQLLAHQLPIIASRIMTLAMVGLIITVFISLISLPPRPPRHRRSRALSMLAQWVLLPATAIVFSAFAAIDAQTRLMLGKYLDFRVTEKATRS